jgi:hypothetical protein
VSDRSVESPGERKVVTISDELTADIVSHKVRLKTTDEPIRTQLIEFNRKTREALLIQISESDLVSGVIHLPSDLPLIIPDEEHTFKTIRFSNNSLLLRFATKSQLAQLRLDDAFLLQKKALIIKRKRLTNQKKRIQTQIDEISNPKDGLTPLGRQMLTTENDIRKQQQKKQLLEQQLEQVDFEIEQAQSEAQKKELLFSGRVRTTGL